MFTLLWVVGVSLTISFLCSILEAVLLSVTHSYVQILKEHNAKAAAILEPLQSHIDEPIAAILTLNTIANTVGAVMGGAIAQGIWGNERITLFSAVLTLVILIYSEIIPKTLGATFWEKLAVPTGYTLRAMILLMKPILVPLNLFTSLIKSERQASVSRAELAILAEISRRDGVIDEAEWEVVTNVIRLDEVQVSEVMTPRTDVIAIPVESSIQDTMKVMLDEGHLRLPIYRGSVDHVEGIVVARDVWRADRDGVEDLSRVIRPVQFIPTSKLVEDLLPEMRAQRSKMSIVVDEFGGTAGLVTLEDLIEEIVGEIQDEHEGDEPLDFQALGEGQTRIWGGVPVREVNEELDLGLDDEPHDTLGGFVFGALNRVARAGDVVDVEGGRFRVTRVKGRRVEYIVFISDSVENED
jgi:magnesium and cobalt exporter, CNNM family